MTDEDIEERMWGASTSDDDAHRAAAADYVAWAAEPHPDDEVSVAWLLVCAGQQHGLIDEREHELAMYERAVADGGKTYPDARCYVIGALLELGRADEADALAATLMKERPRDPAVYDYVGEHYEVVDRLDDANRWLTSGLMRLQGHEDVSRSGLYLLAQSRRRVRLALGFDEDEDEYDVLASPES
jgi:hypothetical protein